MKKVISAVLVMLLAVCYVLPSAASSGLEVHFLDVGQGDCAVVLCDGKSMVIDGGPKTAAQDVYSYIRETLRLSHIDYIVSTHPHVDHVYGLSAVLKAVPADLVLTPVLEWDSWSFRAMAEYAEFRGAVLVVPQEGDTLRLGSAVVTVLHCWPEAVREGRTNDSSIVLRIDYGSTSFLFTGDAEDWSEYMMIDRGAPLKANVLKVSHHGSATASTLEFLKAVSPEYAVISVGADNEHGHPHGIVLSRLESLRCTVLRTDRLGTVVMRSDGESIRIREEKNVNLFSDLMTILTSL